MKKVLSQIDLNLKGIYQLQDNQSALDFLVPAPPKSKSTERGGMLVIQEQEDPSTTDVGICLFEGTLHHLPPHLDAPMSFAQSRALGVAVEEFSHFHYFFFHAQKGRKFSQFEMELQGDIDRFLFLFFGCPVVAEPQDQFDFWYEKNFETYKLKDSMGEVEHQRYVDASQKASRLIRSLRPSLTSQSGSSVLLHFLRHFYRMSQSEKISLIHSL